MWEVDAGRAACGEGWELRAYGVGGEEVTARGGDRECEGDWFMARSTADGEKSELMCVGR